MITTSVPNWISFFPFGLHKSVEPCQKTGERQKWLEKLYITDKYVLETNIKIEIFFVPNSNLNFAAIGSEDDEAYSSFSKKPKSARDPQSHRIIEKWRRDRMNNCLADLSRLLPVAYMKKGRGRIEKTEIIEMTIKHMKHLQVHACKEMGKRFWLMNLSTKKEDWTNEAQSNSIVVV